MKLNQSWSRTQLNISQEDPEAQSGREPSGWSGVVVWQEASAQECSYCFIICFSAPWDERIYFFAEFSFLLETFCLNCSWVWINIPSFVFFVFVLFFFLYVFLCMARWSAQFKYEILVNTVNGKAAASSGAQDWGSCFCVIFSFSSRTKKSQCKFTLFFPGTQFMVLGTKKQGGHLN